MTLLILNTTIITFFFSCLISLSPVNLGITVLLTALSIASIISISASSWFGFIMFIIYVGGMLVMFAYFAALQPNQYITSWSWLLTPSWFLGLLSMLYNNTSIFWTSFTPNVTEIYSSANIAIPLLLALVLFLALIVVVKTARANEGPLRPFSYVQPYSKNSPSY
uniref:NADH-ubiquinone oxidoreductase chain 6 n=1 Tax=Platynereis sp. 1 PA-2020 TaxID=2759231 RepID=A0A7G9UIW0_9ANNE|nr:NADH dehydrogenase subunit 6 [Platynereis sp. 1 PA-2020]